MENVPHDLHGLNEAQLETIRGWLAGHRIVECARGAIADNAGPAPAGLNEAQHLNIIQHSAAAYLASPAKLAEQGGPFADGAAAALAFHGWPELAAKLAPLASSGEG